MVLSPSKRLIKVKSGYGSYNHWDAVTDSELQPHQLKFSSVDSVPANLIQHYMTAALNEIWFKPWRRRYSPLAWDMQVRVLTSRFSSVVLSWLNFTTWIPRCIWPLPERFNKWTFQSIHPFIHSYSRWRHNRIYMHPISFSPYPWRTLIWVRRNIQKGPDAKRVGDGHILPSSSTRYASPPFNFFTIKLISVIIYSPHYSACLHWQSPHRPLSAPIWWASVPNLGSDG